MGIFGGNTPDYSGYQQQMQGTANTYNPYIKGGQAAYEQYQQGANNLMMPGYLQNMLSRNWQSTPGQKQQIDNEKNSMNTNAAMTGTLNSTAQDRAVSQEDAGMNNQFRQHYITSSMHNYMQGLNAQRDMSQTGYDALGRRNNYLQQGYNAQLGGNINQANQGDKQFSDMLAMAGTAAMFM